MTLIIVESPTKARTFNRILKIQKEQAEKEGSKKKTPDYYVYATMGHVRDLPSDEMAVDFAHDFQPKYEIMKGKQKVVDELIKLAQQHKEVIFATDADREGESISYHAAHILGYTKESWPEIGFMVEPPKRIVFHEITPKALEEALSHPQTIRLDLVQAQQARRILDRVVGYELSPLLWKKMGKNWLSAGRVQTVALRFIVEREKEIAAFPSEDHVIINATLAGSSEEVRARLVGKDGTPHEQKHKLQLFAGEYEYTKNAINPTNKDAVLAELATGDYKVSDLSDTTISRFPPPPFTTSLLQQEAISRYGFTSKMVMRLAQDLYERGLITYHRTDSFNLASTFVFRAKDYIAATYGPEYTLEKPRGFRTKSAGAQEAHEAIRPTKVDRDPAEINSDAKLTKNHKMLYELVFNRAVATQMQEAKVRNIKLSILHSKGYNLETEIQQVVFDGFLKVLSPAYVDNHQKDTTIKKGDNLSLVKLEDEQKKIQPPPRYSEATLIKVLEARAIGRPSTYAAILSLIQDKGYVEKEGRYMRPTNLGTAISNYLSTTFTKVFDIDFTAGLEAELDAIAEGTDKMPRVLSAFYQPFKQVLDVSKGDEDKIEVEEENTEPCPKCGKSITLKFSKFGKFYACTGYPDCRFTKPYLKKVPNKQCPKCGGDIVTRFSRNKKKFFGCSKYPECDFTAFSFAQLGKTQ